MHEQAHSLGRGGIGRGLRQQEAQGRERHLPRAAQARGAGAVRGAPGERSPRLPRTRPATTNYHLYGTPVMVGLVNAAGAFPTDFFDRRARRPTGRRSRPSAGPSGPRWRATAVRPASCAAANGSSSPKGPRPAARSTAPEYETLYAFGGSCMVEHALDVARLNERCNLLGIDTISGGNLAAVAIKARQAGRLPRRPRPRRHRGHHAASSRRSPRAPPPPETSSPRAWTTLWRVFGMSDRSITIQGPGPGRLRAPPAQRHGARATRSAPAAPATCGPPSTSRNWAACSRTSTTTPTSRPTSTGKTACC